MMQKLNFREYRGKRLDNDEWIYGSLSYQILDGIFITENRIKHTLEKDLTFAKLDKMCQEVIPESVGQFTGRCTESAVKVFEGDIVKHSFTNKVHDIEFVCNDWEMGVVRYNADYTRYEVMVFKKDGYSYGIIPFTTHLEHHEWEVVGNMTDNPEIVMPI